MRINTHFQEDIQFWQSFDWKESIGIVLLLFQLGMIIEARFSPFRYFCWAPHDCQVEYDLTVTVNGKELNDKEIFTRYQRHQHDRDVRSAAHPQDIIMQYERTYGKNDRTSVIMNYRINGRNQEPWQWSSKP